MNVTIWPSESLISFSTALSRSSNSPRYFAPATIAARSRAISRLSRSESGTSPSTIRWARPSTTAVLPTPGSPISTGLFLVRRDSTWTTRRISASRPITGSSLPSRAAAVRSTPYFSSALKVPSGSADVTRPEPRTFGSAAASASRRGAGRAQRLARRGLPGGDPEQQVLGGDVLVAERLGLGAGRGQRGAHRARDARLAGAPARRGHRGRRRREGAGQRGAVGADGVQQAVGHAAALAEQRDQDVLGLELRVARGRGGLERRGERLGRLGGELRVHLLSASCEGPDQATRREVESIPLNSGGPPRSGAPRTVAGTCRAGDASVTIDFHPPKALTHAVGAPAGCPS